MQQRGKSLVSTRPLTPRTERSHWDTAIRLATGVDPSEVLHGLAQMCLGLAERWGCRVSIAIEPDGDACDTGHFVDIEAESGAIWADMTPWPSRFGGAIPHQLDVELGLAGWILRRDGADPDPIECVCQMPEFMTEHQLAMAKLPSRRLVGYADSGDLASWAHLVAHAVGRVLAPKSDRWFLSADATALSGGALSDHPSNRPGEFYGLWALDLGQLLGPGQWERAVWPAYSEAAYIACEKGLHQYHEPPCPPPCDDVFDDPACSDP